MRESLEGWKGGGVTTGGNKISSLLYTDDITFAAAD